jgi:hypothetical protein
MGGISLLPVGRPGMPRPVPPAEAVRAWVDASCAGAGLSVRVTDATVVAGVAALLGVAPRPAGGGPQRAAACLRVSRRG